MQKLLLFFLFSGSVLLSQTHGSCKLTKTTPDTKTKITFRFVSPGGKPATSHLAFKMNGDTIIQPKIDKKTGIYTMVLAPGTYNFTFYVKFWYDVDSAPIVLKPKTNTMV